MNRWMLPLFVGIIGCSGVRLRFSPPSGALINVTVTEERKDEKTLSSFSLLVKEYSGGKFVLQFSSDEHRFSFVVNRRMGLIPNQTGSGVEPEGVGWETLSMWLVATLPFTCEWLPRKRVKIGSKWHTTIAYGEETKEKPESPVFEMLFMGQEGEFLKIEGNVVKKVPPFDKTTKVLILWAQAEHIPRVIEFENENGQRLNYTFSLEGEEE